MKREFGFACYIKKELGKRGTVVNSFSGTGCTAIYSHKKLSDLLFSVETGMSSVSKKSTSKIL